LTSSAAGWLTGKKLCLSTDYADISVIWAICG